MSLPMLPGYSFADPNKKDFKKTQAFGFKNGHVINKTNTSNLDDYNEEDLVPLNNTMGMTRSPQKIGHGNTNNDTTKKLDAYVPSEMKHYKKVLQFDGHWKEKVGHEVRDRGACIYYFLEDDTIQIVEPKQANSGIQQGTILSRQQVPLEHSLANTAPFQTTLNTDNNMEKSRSPTSRRPTAPAAENTFGKSMKGGVKDPNNYLANLSIGERSPTMNRTASPSTRASPSSPSSGRSSPSYNTTYINPASTKSPTTYHWTDLEVGAEVNFFGKKYFIADADSFTREFYHSQGIELSPAVPLPAALTETKVAPSTRLLSHDLRPIEERHRLRKFLENDRKVLRFYAIWDDSGAVYGERRPFILHYFLVDDCMELREVRGPNSGRDPATTFMKKQKLPKKMTGLSDLKNAAEFYSDADLQIGQVINVFGRKFLLYDADPFTRQYYEDMYGITEFPVVQVEQEVREAVARELPEHTGIGSEEDSLANCLSLVPKPPKKIVKPGGYTAADVMRFTAQMEGGKKGDEERTFVISLFLEDDTLGVFENPGRGIRGGKFLERRKLKNPQTGELYQALDFFVGALLDVNSHKFRLVEADTFAAQYIQEHEEEYGLVSASRIMDDVKRAASLLRPGALRKSLAGQPPLSPASFRQVIGKAGLTLDPTSFNAVVNSFSMGNVVDGSAFLDAVDTNN